MTPPGDGAMTTVGPDELKEALLDKTVARVHERLPDGEAAAVADFVHQYYAQVAPEDLVERNPLDLYGAALSHWRLAQRRLPGEALVHVHTPVVEEHGWQSKHTVVAIVTDDMPFLVDSLSMALTGRGSAIHVVIHPIVHVRRDSEGRLVGLGKRDDARAESFIYAEIDRLPEAAQLEELEQDLLRVLADVRAAVEDWRPMRARALELADELDADAPPIDPEELEEAKALLRWIEAHHLTFLGYREYELRNEDGEDVLRTVPGTGLGVLREKDAKPISRSFAELPAEVRRLARERNVLNLTKANSRATVHRPSYLDYIGVKKLDEQGNPVGERRFLGLYTHTAYHASPWEIPVVRRKVRRVIERAGFAPDSHDEKALVEILWTYPRDELFQISEDELYETAIGILLLAERRRVRLFVRRDTFGRFLSCLVFLPRDRYDTRARRRVERILCEAFGGASVEYTARISESVHARLHYIIYTPDGAARAFDVREIEARVAEAARTWGDDLHAALVDQLGEGRGSRLALRYADAFPLGYQQDVAAPAAVADVNRIEQLDEAGDLGMSLYVPLESRGGLLRFKVLRAGQPIVLSDVLPLLENMGVRVVDEHPYEVRPAGSPPVWIYDFGLQHGDDEDLAPDRLRQDFQDVFGRVFRGEDENDGFNRLVLRAGLNWLQIRLLRAVAKYLRQAGSTFSQSYMESALAANPEIARRLLEVFRLRFDPARPLDADAKAQAAVHEIETALDAVASLDEDRILRSFLRVLLAMLRTNAYQRGPDGESKPYLSFKLDPAQIPDLPAPRPAYEISVYSPRTEGIHLRGGAVARGGIRWSDRREDFRTEVLGLMKAQTVKNAVIVPVGAKGGFVVKLPPADREALREEVLFCYRTLVRGLLDLTDTIEEGRVEPPRDLVRYDGDDPYLVVAADKGTATFSDVANALSEEYGFWLGDAFASGGSAGYDHKAMGITAKGAWESVRRHFRELGVDADEAEITVVGVGDMSGDVFGNGMLLSRRLRVIGAFDHRHVFLDPDPDPEASYEERLRLFNLPSSSWADYDSKLISAGGGVFPRTAKSIPLAPQAQAALGVDVDAASPNELMRMILRAPVDLFWNGGIGTFVKARSESHAEVGDRANDAVRVDAGELHCRVVGEGGNLGFTQRARIEYALRGGRIFMDAIDNSAGVDCSDHEVNIKVLLDAVVAAGDLTEKQRNALLAEMEDEVATLVLRDNVDQTAAISASVAQARSMVDVHARYVRSLEQAGKVDRELEFLPSEETLAERKAAGGGLTAPEFAIVLAYTKIAVYDELLASDVPEDEYLARELERYFPTVLRERFRDWMGRHRLRREIVASQITNGLVNHGGTTFVFRLGEETGATAAEVARAFTAAREIFDLPSLWAEIEALDGQVDAAVQLSMTLKARTLLERSTRWLLRNRPRPLDIEATIERFRAGATTLAESVPELLAGADRAAVRAFVDDLEQAGVPAALASRAAHVQALLAVLDVVETAGETGLSVRDVAAVYFELADRLELHWLRERIAALPREARWDALARRALAEDLGREHRWLVHDVVEEGGEQTPTDALVASWATANAAAVDRWLHLLAEIRAAGVYDLATLSVAVREIRNLIQATPTAPGLAAEPPE